MDRADQSSNKSPEKILVVDDEFVLRKVTSRILDQLGYIVDTAEDGVDAVEKMAKTNFDLVVSDMRMPNMTGMELLKFTRKNYPDTDFLVVTGFSEDGEYINVINEGAIDFIEKPFQTEELTAKVKRVFRERHLIRKYADQALLLEAEVDQHNVDLDLANLEIVNLLRSSYENKKVRYKNSELLKCWEEKNCEKDNCPSYKSNDLRCWQTVGTFCANMSPEAELVDKIRACESCKVYKNATSNPISSIGEQFNIMMTVLETRAQELKDETVRAEQASKAKSDFLANMSHEIRTPLNGIVGMVELAMDGCVDEGQKGFLDTINSEVNALLIIINDILDFSKIEANKLELEEIPFNLVELFDEIAASNGLTAQKKGLDFITYVHPGTPSLLVGDPGRLRQILTNLTNNSLKFTSEGEVFVKAEMIEDFDHKVKIHFQVKDTGIGIAKDMQESIFESFTQADGSTTREYGGTGLGTSICKQLTEIMGGEIGIQSEEGSGSTFWFDLVLVKQAEAQAEQQSVDSNALNDLNILVVNDNKTTLSVVSSYLTFWGCPSIEVKSGSEAFDQLGCMEKLLTPFDLAIIDSSATKVNDSDFIKQINADLRQLKTPIILFTPLDDSKKTIPSLDDTIKVPKPIKIGVLKNAIGNALKISFKQEITVQSQEEALTDLRPAEAPPPKVLLVEDYQTNQQIATMHLQNVGCQVELAENGKQAVDLCSTNEYDIILMDVQMPGMDGYRATELIRESENLQKRRTPIIAVTAHTSIKNRDKCLAVGMDDFLTKPLRRADLVGMLRKWITSDYVSLDAPQKSPIKDNSTTGTASVAAPINIEVALEEFMGDKDLLIEVVEAFIAGAKERIENIDNAIMSGDDENIKREAHTIKGGAANIYADKLSGAALNLEKAGKNCNMTACAEMQGLLKKELARLSDFQF